MPKYYVTAERTVVEQYSEMIEAEDEDDAGYQLNELVLNDFVRPDYIDIDEDIVVLSVEIIEE